MFQQDEIEKLVTQTLKEAQLISRESLRKMSFPEQNQNLIVAPECPGVLFHLQVFASTFVIRIVESENLKRDQRKILENPQDYPVLRLMQDDGIDHFEDKLKFFETDSLQAAKAIKKQMANKRFPIVEEHMINVSDPGDNWWIKRQNDSLEIFFKLCRTESIDSLRKIGPLGDANMTMDFLNRLYGYFTLLFPVRDFSSAHGQFYIGCEAKNNLLFNDFVDIFVSGEIGTELWEKMRTLELSAQKAEHINSLRRANYFLVEIAALRSFWLIIQSMLGR